MDPSAAAAVAAAVAGGTGLLLGARVLPHRRVRASSPGASARGTAGEAPGVEVPAGMIDLVAVLHASAVLVDSSDQVLQASSGAYASGLVRDGRLAHEQLRALVREARRDGRTREIDLDLPRGPVGGETIAVLARVARVPPDLVLAVVEDRTEARRVDAVRRDFVANVSHELKTPVGALSLLAEAVLDANDDPDAVRRFATRMQYETTRLSNLVQELIDLSRLQGHDPLREASLVSVDTVVAEAVDRVRMAAAAKNILLVTAGQRGLTVFGDESQLVTALRNLVDNAVNYSPERTRVAVGVRRRAELVEIRVSDQGLGIPQADLERVFERFYRVDPARSRVTGGTGLGLSIVKHIVGNHGGEVTVWSAEGSGSTFTIRLPVGAARLADDPAQGPPAPRSATGSAATATATPRFPSEARS